jgi:hypothetical protein
MENNFTKTKIWQESLSESSVYYKDNKKIIDYLTVEFFKIRENAKQISDQIIKDNPSLTLHNSKHTDALWEMASIISGNIVLNPLEAFIFGCCAIFHDLGLSLSVYQNNDFFISKEFKDIIYLISSKAEKEKLIQNNFDLETVSKIIIEDATQLRLRQLHAFKARELPKKSWKLNSNTIYIIDDLEIRKFLGDKIGILSESHWWSISKIRYEFGDNKVSAAPISFPSEWSINNIKLACLLRLSDYINIDHRRAPDLSFSLLSLNSTSRQHWTFQNKLNRAILINDTLLFESLEDFTTLDIDAWWLAYNTLQEINKEIREINDLFSELGMETFPSKRIKGIESPESLSKYIKTKDWQPVNTQFKITNVNTLIERFGGVELYGNKLIVPIRELIQNSIDAITVRETYESTFIGKILITYKQTESEEYLIIEDNGIGMTKSILTDFLLDFGKSYWGSKEMLIDHPGLFSSGFKSIGKYGIGFYSTFMISDKIIIISKSFRGSETIALEFTEGLENPPIFRKAFDSEKMFNSGTKIILKLNRKNFIKSIIKELKFAPLIKELSAALKFVCQTIAPAISTQLSIKYNSNSEEKVIDGNDWLTIDNAALLKRLTGFELNKSEFISLKNEQVINEINILTSNISPVLNKEGKIIGRATIIPPLEKLVRENVEGSEEHIVKYIKKEFTDITLAPISNFYSGILTVNGLWENSGFPFSGIWQANNTKLDRLEASLSLKNSEINDWIEEQSILVLKNPYLDLERKLKAVKLLYSFGSKNKKLPLVMEGNTFISIDEFYDVCRNVDYVFLHRIDKLIELKPYFPNVFGVVGEFENNFLSGFEGQLENRDFIIDTSETNKFWSSYKNNNSSNSVFLKKTIETICRAWDYNFGSVEILDLIRESYVNMDKKLLTRNINPERNSKVALIINPKKTTRDKILRKYKQELIEITNHA